MSLAHAAMDFAGKVVIVTGASSGIGAATALMFAKLGAKLSLCGRNSDRLEEVATNCESVSKCKALINVGDLTNEKDVESIVETTIKYFLTIDVLVNNAGILQMGSIENTSLAQFDQTFNLNVRSIFYLTNLAVPYLEKSKGCIVNVSSVNGLRSFPGVLCYNMSKAALDQFTRCTALELASKQIRVNSVNPGVIKSNLHKNAGLDKDAYKAFLEHSKSTHPLGKVGEPNDVANAIVFLASKQSSFITGVTLSVDGGRAQVCPR